MTEIWYQPSFENTRMTILYDKSYHADKPCEPRKLISYAASYRNHFLLFFKDEGIFRNLTNDIIW